VPPSDTQPGKRYVGVKVAKVKVVIPEEQRPIPFTGRIEIPKAPTVRVVTKSYPKK
jgi:hypothetical protein